ncbi:hypothetical protein OAK20_00195 [Synechococcus sp. AH-551-P21]|nr:hypothetical protein [Synechococcus sp. AH-551-P21]
MKKLSIFFILLISSACNISIAEDKTEFNLAVEQCLNELRRFDDHTDQEIDSCVSNSDGICAIAGDDFRGIRGKDLGRISFYTESRGPVLTCIKRTEELNEVCDIRTWTDFIPEEDRNPNLSHIPEKTQFNINCISMNNTWNK